MRTLFRNAYYGLHEMRTSCNEPHTDDIGPISTATSATICHGSSDNVCSLLRRWFVHDRLCSNPFRLASTSTPDFAEIDLGHEPPEWLCPGMLFVIVAFVEVLISYPPAWLAGCHVLDVSTPKRRLQESLNGSSLSHTRYVE